MRSSHTGWQWTGCSLSQRLSSSWVSVPLLWAVLCQGHSLIKMCVCVCVYDVQKYRLGRSGLSTVGSLKKKFLFWHKMCAFVFILLQNKWKADFIYHWKSSMVWKEHGFWGQTGFESWLYYSLAVYTWANCLTSLNFSPIMGKIILEPHHRVVVKNKWA